MLASPTPRRPPSLRVLVWVQYVRGIGHLRRASHIALALASRGVAVTVVSGGRAIPDLEVQLRGAGVAWVQLPPAWRSTVTGKLVEESGAKPCRAWKQGRRDQLLAVFKRTKPHALLLEMYPFGRRKFQFELLPLLNAAHALRPRPAVLCSVRDILVEPYHVSAHHDMAASADAYFDQILVHGDPGVIALDATLDPTCFAKIAHKIVYTGYVVPRRLPLPLPSGGDGQAPAAAPTKAPEVLVSVGSGCSGDPLALFRAALEARALCPAGTPAASARWRLLVGWCAPEELLQACRTAIESAPPSPSSSSGTTPPVVADGGPAFVVQRALLAAGLFESGALSRTRCVVSISMGGYNTVLEGICAGVPMVVVPATSVGDQEQMVRARLMQERMPADLRVVPFEELRAARLAEAITAVTVAAPRADHERHGGREREERGTRTPAGRAPGFFAVDGAEVSADLVADWCRITAAKQRMRSRAVAQGVASAPPRADAATAAATAAEASNDDIDDDAAGGRGAAVTVLGTLPPVPKPTTSELTVVLLNYKRPQNLRRIIPKLLQQTARPEVFLWNNSGKPFRVDGVTWQVDSSENKHCWPRWLVASLARTEYVCVMDDDLIPADDRVLADLLAFLKHHTQQEQRRCAMLSREPTSCIAGPFGMAFDEDTTKPYHAGMHMNTNKFPWYKAARLPVQTGINYDTRLSRGEKEEGASPGSNDQKVACAGEATSVSVDVIKGRMMMLRRDALGDVGFAFDHSDLRGDDIAVSGLLARGRARQHVVPRLLSGRILELPAPHALCSSGTHYSRREAVRRRFFPTTRTSGAHHHHSKKI